MKWFKNEIRRVLYGTKRMKSMRAVRNLDRGEPIASPGSLHGLYNREDGLRVSMNNASRYVQCKLALAVRANPLGRCMSNGLMPANNAYGNHGELAS